MGGHNICFYGAIRKTVPQLFTKLTLPEAMKLTTDHVIILFF